MKHSKRSPKKEFQSDTILPQETRKTSNRQPNITHKTTGKRTKNPQSLWKERNHKDMSRNKLKKVNINKTKRWFFEKIKKKKKTNPQPDSSRKKREESNQQNQK